MFCEILLQRVISFKLEPSQLFNLGTVLWFQSLAQISCIKALDKNRDNKIIKPEENIAKEIYGISNSLLKSSILSLNNV